MKKLFNETLCFVVFLTTIIFSAVAFAQGPMGSGRPNQPDMSINTETKADTVDLLAKDIKETYVFPDVADKLAEMLKERQASGEYDSIASAKQFSQLLTKQMAEVAHDAHLRVFYSYDVPPLPKSGQAPGPSPRRLLWLKRNNYGFAEVQRLSGNIGYLNLSGFTDAERGGDTLAGAMAFLANTDALIIDLRESHGGTPEMVDLLASYFFSGDRSVHLNDLSWRKEGTTEHVVQQWWTLPYVPGKRYVGKEVYILTSRNTPSAAEEFTYDLKALKRAVVVGEKTWGGANPGGIDPLGDHFSVFIPTGHAINPITKTNWEGKGVEPDIKVSQQDALETAHRTALDHLITKTTDEQVLSILKRALAGVESEPSGLQQNSNSPTEPPVLKPR